MMASRVKQWNSQSDRADDVALAEAETPAAPDREGTAVTGGVDVTGGVATGEVPLCFLRSEGIDVCPLAPICTPAPAINSSTRVEGRCPLMAALCPALKGAVMRRPAEAFDEGVTRRVKSTLRASKPLSSCMSCRGTDIASNRAVEVRDSPPSPPVPLTQRVRRSVSLVTSFGPSPPNFDGSNEG